MSSGELLRGFLKGKDIYFPYYEVSWIMDINLGFFQRYDTLLLRKELQSMPDFRWCKNAQASCIPCQNHPAELIYVI